MSSFMPRETIDLGVLWSYQSSSSALMGERVEGECWALIWTSITGDSECFGVSWEGTHLHRGLRWSVTNRNTNTKATNPRHKANIVNAPILIPSLSVCELTVAADKDKPSNPTSRAASSNRDLYSDLYRDAYNMYF